MSLVHGSLHLHVMVVIRYRVSIFGMEALMFSMPNVVDYLQYSVGYTTLARLDSVVPRIMGLNHFRPEPIAVNIDLKPSLSFNQTS